MPDWEHTTWIRVTLFFSFLLVTSLKSNIRVDLWWWMYGVGSGISCQWWDVAGWWDVGGERGSPFIVKYEAFLLVGTPTEAFVLVGVWTMSSDWSGYEGWTMYPDWSELNHALWLVRTWWLKNVWTEPWIVIGQNLMTENKWAEPWLVIGQNLMTENMGAEPWVLIGQNFAEWILQADWPRLIMYL